MAAAIEFKVFATNNKAATAAHFPNGMKFPDKKMIKISALKFS